MKWRAAISLFILVSRAVSEEWTGPDDILAMLQGGLKVKRSSNTSSPTNENESPQEVMVQDGLDMHAKDGPDLSAVSHLEEMVLNRLKENDFKGDKKLTAVINGSIKNMMKAILATTNANQKLMKLSILAFKKCKTKMWRNYGRALPYEKRYWQLKTIYPKCIRAENKLKLQKLKVWKIYKKARDIHTNYRKLARIQGKKCVNTCSNHKNENYHEQLQRLVEYYGKCRKSLGPLMKKEKQAKKIYIKEYKRHYVGNAKYKAMNRKCRKIAYLMNTRKCQSVTKLDTGCRGYGTCWKIALRNYNRNMRGVMVHEKNMKVQWRALKRIQCYLQVVDDKPKKVKGKVVPNKVIINNCIKMKKPSTKHLNIDYGRIPKKPKCPRDKMCPCTTFYVVNSYTIGPKQRCAKNLVRKYKCPACKKRQWRR
jgi:hypothetical protein